jgi:hypothetical protein
MATATVFLFGLKDFFSDNIFFVGPSPNNLFKWSQRIMKALCGLCHSGLMAFSASLISKRKGGIPGDAFVCCFPIRVFWIASMTGMTGNISVLSL